MPDSFPPLYVAAVKAGLRAGKLSAVLEDLVGSIEVTVWSDVYERTRELWTDGKIVKVSGRVKQRDDRISLVADEAMDYLPGAADIPEATESGPRRRRVKIVFREYGQPAEDCSRFDKVVSLLQSYPGDDPVQLVVTDGRARVRLDLPSVRGLNYSPALRDELDRLVGSEATTLDYIEVELPPAENTDRTGRNGRNGLKRVV